MECEATAGGDCSEITRRLRAAFRAIPPEARPDPTRYGADILNRLPEFVR